MSVSQSQSWLPIAQRSPRTVSRLSCSTSRSSRLLPTGLFYIEEKRYSSKTPAPTALCNSLRSVAMPTRPSATRNILGAPISPCNATRHSRWRPRVFFGEWDDPLISGIGWVSELIEIAGGVDIFADRRHHGAAKDRIATMAEVVERQPDLIIGSWCGKKFRPERPAVRPGFAQIPAVQHQDVYEVKSPLILQPGPAALTDGLAELQRIIQRWAIRC
jgi:hypothetical protein